MPFRMTVRRESQLFTSSGYFTVPPGVFRVYVAGYAAGGGGGGNFSTGGQRGPGGGGGAGEACARIAIDVTPGEQIYVTIGAGGNPGTSGNPGSSGGVTSFGSYKSLTGGGGGQAGVGTLQGGIGGQAGGPSASHGETSWSTSYTQASGGLAGTSPLGKGHPSGGSQAPYGAGGAGAIGNMAASLSGEKGGDGMLIVDW